MELLISQIGRRLQKFAQMLVPFDMTSHCSYRHMHPEFGPGEWTAMSVVPETLRQLHAQCR